MIQVANDAALLVDALSVEDIRNGIDTLISNDQLRQDLIEKGRKNRIRFSGAHIAEMYYSLYHEDLKLYDPKSLKFKLIYTILLGVASNKKGECRSLINYAAEWPIKALGNLVMLLPPSLIQLGIIRYSKMKTH